MPVRGEKPSQDEAHHRLRLTAYLTYAEVAAEEQRCKQKAPVWVLFALAGFMQVPRAKMHPRGDKTAPDKAHCDEAKNATVRRFCARNHENKEFEEELTSDAERLYFRKYKIVLD